MNDVFFVTTNWCAINKYKANAYWKIIKNLGFSVTTDKSDASVVVFLMCSFTGEREEDSINQIKYFQSQGKKVIVAWCTLPEIIKKLDNVDVIPNEIIPFNNLRTLLGGAFDNVSETNFIPSALENNSTIIQIATWCTGNCKYCSIKSAQLNKWILLSVHPDEIIDQISKIENDSIYLAGNEVSAYGLDIGYSLPYLLKKIRDNFPEINIHLGNLGILTASKRDEDDLNILSKVTWNICLPIQSWSNKVIKEMWRNYTIEQFDKLYKELTSRWCSIMTDYIIWYPTETDDDFHETLDFIKRYPMEFSQIFAYEPRDNTPAANLKPLSEDIIEDRVCEAIATYLKMWQDSYWKVLYYNSNVQFV